VHVSICFLFSSISASAVGCLETLIISIIVVINWLFRVA